MLKVTCALIIRENKILITQNNCNSEHPFQWEFPGGKINIAESPENCIQREIMEELALEIEILGTMKPIKYDYGFKNIKLFPFLCSIKKGKIQLNEHNDFMWIEFEELKNINFSGADQKLIQQEQNLAILKKYLGK